jgi:hypothetical protein
MRRRPHVQNANIAACNHLTLVYGQAKISDWARGTANELHSPHASVNIP